MQWSFICIFCKSHIHGFKNLLQWWCRRIDTFYDFLSRIIKNRSITKHNRQRARLKAPSTPLPLLDLFNYFRLYGPRCGGCGDGISPSDLVRRARDKVYHVKCFSCQVLVFAVCAKMFAKRGVWY